MTPGHGPPANDKRGPGADCHHKHAGGPRMTGTPLQRGPLALHRRGLCTDAAFSRRGSSWRQRSGSGGDDLLLDPQLEGGGDRVPTLLQLFPHEVLQFAHVAPRVGVHQIACSPPDPAPSPQTEPQTLRLTRHPDAKKVPGSHVFASPARLFLCPTAEQVRAM